MSDSPDNSLSRWQWSASVILIGWVVAISVVWWNMTAYSFQIDGEASPLDAWPDESQLSMAEDRPTVLLFLHPRCPCSVASLTELERAIAETPADRQPRLLVLATVPAQHDAPWTESNNIRHSQQLPNVKVVIDVGGRESHKFGVASSGHVMAFAPTGELLFSGGVTQSRGHEGNNVGRASLVRALAKNEAQTALQIPVFGCRLCLPKLESATGSDPASSIELIQASFP